MNRLKDFNELLNNPEWLESVKLAEEGREIYRKSCDSFWNSLSYEDQLKAFHSVVSRIHDGEINDERSYRGVLYDVFGFGPEAYSIGMDCGYLTLHNYIMSKEEYEESHKKLRNPDGSIQY